jgi:hypothetical protein
VISEVMYNPLSPDGITDNTLDEFIELANITGASVPLFDPLYPTNRWIVQGGVSFTFPRDTSLAAGAVALLVSFDRRTQRNWARSKRSILCRILRRFLDRISGNWGMAETRWSCTSLIRRRARGIRTRVLCRISAWTR